MRIHIYTYVYTYTHIHTHAHTQHLEGLKICVTQLHHGVRSGRNKFFACFLICRVYTPCK